IPRSRLTTWHGQPTSGTTTLAYALIAQAQTNQMVAVYLDVSHTFDPESAVCQGIDMRRLLLVRPASWGQALELLRDVVDVPVAGLLTLDTAIVRSGLPAQWHALARTLQRVGARLPQSPWTVLALLPQNIPETAAGSASVRLRVERKAWLHTAEVLRGYEVQITVLKNKLKPAAEPVILDLELRG